MHGVSLAVRAGEIVGVAGLIGSGRTELARVLFGLTPADGGRILLARSGGRYFQPSAAIARGIAYVPEDRRKHGVIMEMPVAANCTLASLRAFSYRGMLIFNGRTRRSRFSRAIASEDSLRASCGEHALGRQSAEGCVGRWLMVKPAVLILDEPTQGVDVGAKAEIHKLIGELATQGMAILMISSELPEILGMSDRIVVMRRGAVAGTLERRDATQERIVSLALGSAA